jgi:hypothetical protein
MRFWHDQEELENHIDSRHPHLSVGGDFSVCLGTARSEHGPKKKIPISALVESSYFLSGKHMFLNKNEIDFVVDVPIRCWPS